MSLFFAGRRAGLSLSASIAALALAGIAQPAFAQAVDGTTDDTVQVPTNAEGQATDDAPIVVTGSRLRRDNFNTASPVVVIGRDERVLAGARSTSDVLQSSTVTSGTSQINGSFLGFVSEGGAAANTIGLRGLSSSRTLVLLNGRRLAPAGVGPQLVSADLNVLPTSVVQRIEVLREGASSVYGSDAIAGVVNIITDVKVNGLTLDAYTDQPVMHGGGGRTYRLSATGGKTFDRGHITLSAEYQERTGLRVGDREEFSCPRDRFFDPTTGAEVGQIDPATGQLQCFPYTTGGGSGTASGYGIAQSFTLPASRLTYTNGNINTISAVNGLNRVSPSPTQLQDHLISPVRTYTGYANGAYELGILGDAEIYGEALFNRRESHQDSSYQLNLSGGGLSDRNEIYGGNFFGTPLSAYGYPVSPFFPNSVANAGYNIFTPFVIPDRTTRSSQRVDFYRGNVGLRGSIGVGDWRYDANFQYSHTDARSTLQLITVDRLNNSLQTVVAPAGTPDNLVTVSLPGQGAQFPGDTTFGPAGTRYTCASNVTGGVLKAGASCVPLNIYDPAIAIGGHIPDNVFNYLFTDNVGTTQFTQQTISLNFDGTLFNLPAGPVRAAIGFEHRYDHIDDQPSAAAQSGTLYNYSSGGITRGSDLVNEVYGEVNVPLLRDQPFAQNLEVSGSARLTDYRSYGSDVTYRVNANWAPVDVLRIRASYGTSFRAPNLYEQFVADQTGFYGAAADPCSDVASLPAGVTRTNCLAALTPILGAAAASTFISTAGPQVTTRGGAGNLQAEHSRSWGLGGVITLPRNIADFALAVDYFNVHVEDEVSNLGTLILSRCYEATDFGPGNPYCALIAPRLPASDAQKGNLDSFLNPYLNVAQQNVSGIDFDVRYATGLFGGKLVVHGQATRMIHQTFQLFDTDPLVDYNGTLGVQGAGAGPKWVGSADVRYTLPSDNVTIRYGVHYVGPQDSTDNPAAAPFVGNINADLRAETYWEHSASIQFRWQDVGQFTLGVNNLFNALPPAISSYPTSGGQFTRVGNRFNSSNYDLLGRSVFVNVTRSF